MHMIKDDNIFFSKQLLWFNSTMLLFIYCCY